MTCRFVEEDARPFVPTVTKPECLFKRLSGAPSAVLCPVPLSPLQSTRAIDQASGEGHQDGKTMQSEKGNRDRRTE
jgi:hypothetical protein